MIDTLKLKHLLKRLPVVRQQSETDCGAACLATICRYDRKYVSLNRLRELARVGQSGASMYNLIQAAKSLGYEAFPILEIYENFAKSDRPAIVNWRGYHWIVVYRATDQYVTIADPGQGLIKIPKDDFLDDWTRYTIHLTPTEKVKNIEESKPSLNQFIPYIKPYWKPILEIALASFMMQIMVMLLPVFTKFMIDEVVIKQNSQWLYISLVAVSAISILNITISYFRQQLSLFVSLKATLLMVTDFYQHVLALPISYFTSRKVGDVTSRFGENQKIVSFFTDIGLQTFLNVISAILYLGLMFYFNVSLTLIACLFLFLHLVNVYLITPSLQRVYRDVFQKGADADSFAIESLSGLSTIKTMGIEHATRWQVENLYVRANNAYLQTINLGIISNIASGLVSSLSDVAVLFFGAVMVMRNQLTIGELVAFTTISKSFSAPIMSLIGVWDVFQETLNAVERLNDVFETKPELNQADAKAKIQLPKVRGHIRFDNLVFRYEPDSDRNILQNINLEIHPSQRIALVGRSGSSKSTLIKLLLGFYSPTSGNIYLDGFNVQDAWLPSLRKQIGIVPQQSHLFRGTVRDNIARGKPKASLLEIIEAATLAHAHEFITNLPHGYDSIVEEEGSNFSGGQRQRLTIARALIRKPQILILDEATSALDNETEKIVLDNINHAFGDRTMITIAHRLSTVRQADLVVVLDHGNIVETGTHDQLMANRNLYYYLSTQQLNL
jgi:HlyB family type I secretion system ABC transporter